jgi:hypothetical protein
MGTSTSRSPKGLHGPYRGNFTFTLLGRVSGPRAKITFLTICENKNKITTNILKQLRETKNPSEDTKLPASISLGISVSLNHSSVDTDEIEYSQHKQN